VAIRIINVLTGSPACSAGISAGEWLNQINHEYVLDEIDYQALTASPVLLIDLTDAEGKPHHVRISKAEWEPLGLVLDETQIMRPRSCRNHCVFCFVDQLPAGMRNTLYVKDDDWRLSMMMGNYVTLTNVDETEFRRILRRKASPLYISVHATDPTVRQNMMKNPNSVNLMERLHRLKDHGLTFHSQIVLCPGINDGDVLRKSISDLAAMYPASQSLALVPVGLTAHRDGLSPLRMFDPESAQSLIREVEVMQNTFLASLGTRFVFPSDEFYCISGLPLPENDAYEDYIQIENGVGMLRKLEQECQEAYAELITDSSATPAPKHILIPTGISAQPYIQHLADCFSPAGTRVDVLAVHNRFFGETITVTGLLVGRDLEDALIGKDCDQILLSSTMLKEFTDRFLDDMTLSELSIRLNKPIRVVPNDGESFVRALWEMED